MHPPRPAEQEISSDPDNIPPRSRLFIVVPKQADPQQINVGARGCKRARARARCLRFIFASLLNLDAGVATSAGYDGGLRWP